VLLLQFTWKTHPPLTPCCIPFLLVHLAPSPSRLQKHCRCIRIAARDHCLLRSLLRAFHPFPARPPPPLVPSVVLAAGMLCCRGAWRLTSGFAAPILPLHCHAHQRSGAQSSSSPDRRHIQQAHRLQGALFHTLPLLLTPLPPPLNSRFACSSSLMVL